MTDYEKIVTPMTILALIGNCYQPEPLVDHYINEEYGYTITLKSKAHSVTATLYSPRKFTINVTYLRAIVPDVAGKFSVDVRIVGSGAAILDEILMLNKLAA